MPIRIYFLLTLIYVLYIVKNGLLNTTDGDFKVFIFVSKRLALWLSSIEAGASFALMTIQAIQLAPEVRTPSKVGAVF